MEHILDDTHKSLIDSALRAYQTGETMFIDKSVAMDFAEHMLEKIRSGA